jgi:hypothetical protein
MGVVILATMLTAGRSALANDGSPTMASSSAASISRVRSSHPAISTMIRDAAERSATFRGLLQVIDASDGIVYVESGACGNGVRACIAGVTVAGENRIVWVKVDTKKEDWDLMRSIGHELGHVVEILGERAVTNNAAMYHFYARIGSPTGEGMFAGFETTAAVKAGEAVSWEVRRSMRAAQGR